jgi:hypothetical protein
MIKKNEESKRLKGVSVCLISFATENYRPSAQLLSNRARKLEFDSITIYSLGNLDPIFIKTHEEILSHRRGAGYWLWKPWIVNKQINELNSEEVCLYLDAGAIPCKPASYFGELAKNGKIHVWLDTDAKLNSNRNWTDPNVWQNIIGSDSGLDSAHVWAGALVFSNQGKSKNIISEWLTLCCNAELLCPDRSKEYEFSLGQVGHRHDQSILNCLVHKYPEVFTIHILSNEFIIHRRGYLSSEISLLFFRVLRFCYRKFLGLLPQNPKLLLLKVRTLRRKPDVQNSELEAHKLLWKKQGDNFKF